MERQRRAAVHHNVSALDMLTKHQEVDSLREKLHLTFTFGLGLALLVLHAYIELDLISHLVRDVGIALLVGGYLMVTIERRNKLKIQEEVYEYVRVVGENFITAVYGSRIPMEL